MTKNGNEDFKPHSPWTDDQQISDLGNEEASSEASTTLLYDEETTEKAKQINSSTANSTPTKPESLSPPEVKPRTPFFQRNLTKALIPAVILLVFVMISTGKEFDNTPKIGMVNVVGVITESVRVIDKLQELENDSNVKGIIIKVDSPGGVVASSQEIYNYIKKVAEFKPIYVSMENVAASGGYYISLGANKIYANPGTITGSIGVIMQGYNAEELMEKIGVKPLTYKSGEKKDILSTFRPPTEEEKDIIQTTIDMVYHQFIQAVADGRGMSVDEAEIIADGRIYNGEQAFQAGLVDGLMDFDTALDALKNETNFPNAILYEPKSTEEEINKILGIETGVSYIAQLFNLSNNNGMRLMTVLPGWH